VALEFPSSQPSVGPLRFGGFGYKKRSRSGHGQAFLSRYRNMPKPFSQWLWHPKLVMELTLSSGLIGGFMESPSLNWHHAYSQAYQKERSRAARFKRPSTTLLGCQILQEHSRSELWWNTCSFVTSFKKLPCNRKWRTPISGVSHL
jgi:hypothetical protein